MADSAAKPRDAARKERLARRIRRARVEARQLLGKEIWEVDHLGGKSLRARAYCLLRILILTWQGLRRNRIHVQAAALTFYSLIGLGPLIALGIMVSGFMVEQGDENLAVNAITQAISFAAPQLTLEVAEGETGAAGSALTPEMTQLINGFIERAQSGAVGIVGSLMLFVIGIQVLSSIEGSFNSLWGVERGRKLTERIVVYWTFISLGAVIGAATLALGILRTLSGIMEKVPFGGQVFELFLLFSPVFTFFLVAFLLSIFFRFIPNTQVDWRPAFTGAVIVVLLLYLYNLLSFLYVQQVVNTRSLYGSVGILVVLMIGLYVFWLLILFGGQITYAVQNADFLTNENAWQNISERCREIVSLGVLLLVAQRFRRGEAPIRTSELHNGLRVPSHILNSSVNRLCEMGLLSPVEGRSLEAERDRAYQPARPLEALKLGQFKQSFECFGNNDGAEFVAETAPSVGEYLGQISALEETRAARTSIGDLLDQKPF